MAVERRQAPESASFEVTVGNRTVHVALRRSRRAQRYTLRLVPGGHFVLTMPERGSEARAVAFARAQAGWIRTRMDRLIEPVPFEPGAVIPVRDTPHEIRLAGTRRGLIRLDEGQGHQGRPVIVVPGDPRHLSRRLNDWLKAQARADLEAAALRHAAAAGVSIARVSVRDQVSRWGSCSANGALSFSWRLILAPPMVLDYLAAHEVTHRLEMNHSARFWRHLRRLAPHTDSAEAWLKRHGASLHRYGAR